MVPLVRFELKWCVAATSIEGLFSAAMDRLVPGVQASKAKHRNHEKRVRGPPLKRVDRVRWESLTKNRSGHVKKCWAGLLRDLCVYFSASDTGKEALNLQRGPVSFQSQR